MVEKTVEEACPETADVPRFAVGQRIRGEERGVKDFAVRLLHRALDWLSPVEEDLVAAIRRGGVGQ